MLKSATILYIWVLHLFCSARLECSNWILIESLLFHSWNGNTDYIRDCTSQEWIWLSTKKWRNYHSVMPITSIPCFPGENTKSKIAPITNIFEGTGVSINGLQGHKVCIQGVLFWACLGGSVTDQIWPPVMMCWNLEATHHSKIYHKIIGFWGSSFFMDIFGRPFGLKLRYHSARSYI